MNASLAIAHPTSAYPVTLILLAVSATISAQSPAPQLGTPHPTQSSYQLVWQDEFSGSKLDRKKWTPEDDSVIGQYGHGNGEAQVYLDAEGQTFRVGNGHLSIIANHAPQKQYPLRDGPGGRLLKKIDHQDFQSAKLTTQQQASFTYGIFEARIKNPTHSRHGRTAIPTWPAFWLLPETRSAPYSGYWDQAAAKRKSKASKSNWPYSGEIDVMEMSGRSTRLYHAGAVYHNHASNWTVGHIRWHSHYRRFDGVIDPRQWIADQKLDPNLQPKSGQSSYPQDYHIYGCHWTPKKITFT
ncbi:MAG: glycoside hydrolase family 16 protein, partial [Planctomycetota bacterium]|nr:glycoside hydrolase family 16 protein [Planctomycetota bacterium]